MKKLTIFRQPKLDNQRYKSVDFIKKKKTKKLIIIM